jgi:hypothetical protein
VIFGLGDQQPSQQRADVEAELSGAVRNLIVSVEAYPDLKSNTNFLELQRQLAETEDRIANGRRYYNANVRVYNTKVESVPTNIIANVFKFEKATYFEVNDPAVRQAPNVSFGEIAYRGDQQQAPAPSQGQLPQQGLPIALAAVLRQDVEILQIQPRAAQEGGEVVEEEGKAHLFSVLQGEEYLRIAAVKELLGQKFLGGDDLVGHLFILRQRPDKGEDLGRVLPDGKAKGELRHAQSSA